MVSVYSVAQSTAHIHRQAKSLLEHNLALSIDVLPIVKSYSKANLDDNSSLSDSAILLIHVSLLTTGNNDYDLISYCLHS